MPRIIGDAALLSAFAPLEAYPSAALAVSGGPDSMALMHLASRWLSLKRREPASIAVLTVDHGLRPESAGEAAFVAAQAKGLGFTHATLAWTGKKPKTGIQAAARTARYGLMSAYCREQCIACLITAHTGDDQAETFLMRLRRGSGLDGLAAMATVSDRGGVPIVRPLLGLTKARLTAYLRSLAVPFASDPSNRNMDFERVRLRHAMKALTAAGIARPALALTASRLSRSREALSGIAAEFLERNFSVTSLGQGQISLEAFQSLSPEIALRVLSRALALVGGKDEPPRMAKVERLLEELSEGRLNPTFVIAKGEALKQSRGPKCERHAALLDRHGAKAPREDEVELRASKKEAALGGCLIVAAGGFLNFYREPGRMGSARLSCLPGSSVTWDGRFALTFATDLSASLTVAPLGTAGWAICRKALKERGKAMHVNWLAALASPALWDGARLVFAPAMAFADAEIDGQDAAPLHSQLVPRLSHFHTST